MTERARQKVNQCVETPSFDKRGNLSRQERILFAPDGLGYIMPIFLTETRSPIRSTPRLGTNLTLFRRGSRFERIRSGALVSLSTLAASLGFLAPAKAYQVFFNAPNVLGGIRGVPITLPSTGSTDYYDVILKKGSLEDVFGSPPALDVSTSGDAQTLMEKSANAINAYIKTAFNPPLSFAEAGEDAYSIPYARRLGGIDVSYSLLQCPSPPPGGVYVYVPPPGISYCMYPAAPDPISYSDRVIVPRLDTLPLDSITVWVDLQPGQAPVPSPLPLAGGVAAWSWARRIRRRISLA